MVNGGEKRNVTMWNHRIFGLERMQRMAGTNDMATRVDFPLAARMVEDVLRETGGNGDPHIATQSQLCGLHMIKYDFIGRFERLEDDVAAVVRHLNRSDVDPRRVFRQGSAIHKTRAERRLRKAYDRATVAVVQRAYASDLRVPLNGIQYDLPDALQDLMGGSGDAAGAAADGGSGNDASDGSSGDGGLQRDSDRSGV
eukprot:TRINITY_DN8291_c0_g1_i1.p3 TRINITY_DN8291_c0_g1~~TRINITY_DN8291_c0_g1_i1.p3  ORF type:complete len:230 (+),score=10.78 TRINITY_DN8291_c0_g1_i1:97-690(+)